VVAGGMVGWNIYLQQSKKVEPASSKKMAFPLPDNPSIAVLPFDNMSGDPEQDYLADGISENIISTLSKIPDLFVISRNSTFTYKGKPVKTAQVSEELGVRYVLEGSVQKFGDRLRISAQLIDAVKGHHLWAETYDRDSKHLFIVMDEITLKIAKGLSVELYGGLKESKRGATENLEAWISYYKGFYLADRLTKEDIAKGRENIERALEIDPNFASAWGRLSLIKFHEARYGWDSNRNEAYKLSKKFALKALEIDDTQSSAYATLGNLYLMQKEYSDALSMYEKCIAVNPNDPDCYWCLARAYRYIGQSDKAIPITKKGMRLNPHHPWYYPYALGRCYYRLRKYEDAIFQFEQVIKMCQEGQCSLKWPNLYLSQVYSELGQYEKARSHMQIVLEHDPKFNIQDRSKLHPYKFPAMHDREIEALRKAGAPERPPS
jgi:adenylate cyclase